MKKKEISCIITNSSNHILFWHSALNMLRKMDFVESGTHKYIRHNSKCLSNWIWTIEGAQHLWNTLRKSGFSSLNLKFLNQDPVENCFSQIRDHGHRNNNPSPYQFCASFKTLVTTNFTSKHSVSSNCKEEYEGKSMSLAKVISVAENKDLSEEETAECAETIIPLPEISNPFVDVKKIVSILANKVKCEVNCAKCLENEEIKNYAARITNCRIKIFELLSRTECENKTKKYIIFGSICKNVHTLRYTSGLFETGNCTTISYSMV